MNSTFFLACVMLMFAGISYVNGTGRRMNDEEFAKWHREYGRTAKMMGVLGFVLSAILFCAGIFERMN